jgi:hypothetical protein
VKNGFQITIFGIELKKRIPKDSIDEEGRGPNILLYTTQINSNDVATTRAKPNAYSTAKLN